MPRVVSVVEAGKRKGIDLKDNSKAGDWTTPMMDELLILINSNKGDMKSGVPNTAGMFIPYFHHCYGRIF